MPIDSRVCYACKKGFESEGDIRLRFNKYEQANVIFHPNCEGAIDWDRTRNGKPVDWTM